LVLQLVICAGTRHFIMSGYEANAGGFVEFHVWDNLKFWLNPMSYLSFYNLIGKGIFTPSLENPLMLVPLALFFGSAWRATPRRYRIYFLRHSCRCWCCSSSSATAMRRETFRSYFPPSY
jgi:hypothetical protein